MRPLIDSHLDLAWNALSFNRDMLASVADVRQLERNMTDELARSKNTLTFPELRRANIPICVATLMARSGPDQPRVNGNKRTDLDYVSQAIAYAHARGQLAYYRLLEEQNVLRFITTRTELTHHWNAWGKNPESTPLGIILSMEGADPILAPEQAQSWWDLGLRAVGPVHYGRGQYAYGTATDGPLSERGVVLLQEFMRIGMILDVTHLADQSFFDALDVYAGPILASHHNCRALVPGDRQLSDEQIKLLIERDAVIGTAFDAWMMFPGWQRGVTQPSVVGIDAAADHIDHICQLAGNAKHCAIGSDLDGGYGTEQTPHDLDTITDIHKLETILEQRGYSSSDIDGIFFGNWLRFFENALPLLFFCVAISMQCFAADKTLLFVDDHEILYRSGTHRVVHQPRRHPDNPLLVGPTLKNQIAYNSVYRDPDSGRYQMWYQMTGKDCVVCYAESEDGVRWTKPELDLMTLIGIADRNVVLSSVEQYGASVVVDPPGIEKTRRYKLAYWSIPLSNPATDDPSTVDAKDPRGPNGGMFIAFSPDGIHWTKYPEGPALRGSYGRIVDPPLAGKLHPFGLLNSVSDVVDASFDPLRKKYVVYTKGWIDAPDGRTFWKRAIMRSESDDFVEWSPAQLVMAPDEFDGLKPAAYPGTRQGVQLHGAPTFVHHGVYFALLQVADFETHGLQPIELAISRDGIAWSRPFRSTPFLPVTEAGNFDSGRIWSNATPIVLEDEIHFYFGGAENSWHFGKQESPWGSKKKMPKTGVGLASLPLDRFVGLRPIEKIGQITTKPQSFEQVKYLTLNADASTGVTRVELLDKQGYRLEGFTKADAIPINDDGLRHSITWKNRDLKDLPPGEFMIRIHLENAEVFALTIH
jgi:membrane dipeptidase